MKDGHYFDQLGREVWVQNGKFHRLDGPAIIDRDGAEWWCQNGPLHRDDGPARTFPDGSKEYWLNGVRYIGIQNDVLWRIEIQKMKRQEKRKRYVN